MYRKILALLFVLPFLVALPAGAVPPNKSNYESKPYMVSTTSIPQVLLVVSKELKMYGQAYTGLTDFDGDGRVDTGFNPGVVYVGYFDSYSCYAYSGKDQVVIKGGANGYSTRGGDKNGYFYRVGDSVADDETITRPSGLKRYVVSPRSATGVCGRKVQVSGATFSGNWLNYMTSSRMDVIRKILYGGTRSVDTASDTRLEASFIPPDSTVWGTEVVADNIWQATTPLSAYFDITKYTPFSKPKDGKSHFFARTRDMGTSAYFPVIRIIENASSDSFNVGGTDSVSEPIYDKRGRYWEWALGNRPVPDDKVLKSGVRDTIKTYNITVQVCNSSSAAGIGRNEGCRQYPNGSYKPTGLLQQYGSSDQMHFGLMTGVYRSDLRKQGGVMRNHVDTLASAIDPSTGQVVKNGLVSNFDRLRISGRHSDSPVGAKGSNSVSWGTPGPTFMDENTWYNPIGEMLYEAVRYMGDLSSPTNTFVKYADEDKSPDSYASTVSPIKNLTRLTKWDGNDRPQLAVGNCSKPVIMVISDTSGDYDGDDFSGSDPGKKLLKGLDSSTLPSAFNLSNYLSKITEYEGLASSVKGKDYFFSTAETDDCTPKSLTSLGDVKGLCPTSPHSMGTYSLAAVAYYAHTHNFSKNANNETPIDIYAVTMASPYPELTFPVMDSNENVLKSISVIPVNITSGNGAGRVLGFLNYYAVDWQTDKKGMPFSVTIQVNFSDVREGGDHEMDVIVEYNIELITNVASIRSDWLGPKVTDQTKYNKKIDSGIYKGRTDFYTFKNNPDAEDKEDDRFINIDPSWVQGLIINSKFDTVGTTANMGLGYTISGIDASSATGKVYNTYLELPFTRSNNVNGMPTSDYWTPTTCNYSSNQSPCGKPELNPRTNKVYARGDSVTRSFKFADNNKDEFLPNPMWLAAKYGGFNDVMNTGNPNTPGNIWDSKVSGVPDNYFQATNIAELATQLGAAFQAISSSVATGTATAASINSVLGGGVSIQAMFYPEYPTPAQRDPGENLLVEWAGNVYGLFVDKWGNLREDTNGNGQLDLATGELGSTEDGTAGDWIIQIVPQDGREPLIYRWKDPMGTNEWVSSNLVGNRSELKYIWNTAQWMAELSDSELIRDGYKSAGGRMIFTYFDDLPAEGQIWSRAQALTGNLFHVDKADDLAKLMVHDSTLSAPVQFSGTSSSNYFFISASGELPPALGVSKLMVRIQTGQSENSIGAAKSGDTLTVTIKRKTGDATASSVVASINEYSYGTSPSYPLIRASLRPGNDLGEWNVAQATKEISRDKPAETAELLIEYVSGLERPGWRSRLVKAPATWRATKPCTIDSSENGCVIWRLGDVINSKPIIVGGAASNYDLIYGDRSFDTYKTNPNVAQRRQMVYFGSNGGMLHAVNLGFYGSLSDGRAGYKTVSDLFPSAPKHDLGAEIWSFVPRSVLPHLQWLPDLEYGHSYYVDLKPQVVDIKNNTGKVRNYSSGTDWEEKEWRTVLIGGLRLGGNTIEMPKETKPEYSHSEFFAIDITDPEEPPVLLWRYSHKDLGLTTAQPTVISNEGRWYVLLASGPTSDNPTTGEPSESVSQAPYNGTSTQNAKIIVLDAVTGEHQTTLTVPEANSFFNDSFTPIVSGKAKSSLIKRESGETVWTNPVVYFGLTQNRDSEFQDKGALYRLVMVDTDGLTPLTKPSEWKLVKMFDSQRPVTGAANSTYDSSNNLWVVFGTGRVWGSQDAFPCSGLVDDALTTCETNHIQRLIGIKEPVNSSGIPTYYDTVPNTDTNILDVSDIKVYSNGSVTGGGYASYDKVREALASASYDGYSRKLENWKVYGSNGTFELCPYQPKIEGLGGGASLTTFTTYELSTEECNPDGQSYLYLVDTYTGLPYPAIASYNMTLEGISNVESNDGSSRVYGTMKAGRGKSTEAWIVKTDTGIRVGTTGQDTSIYSVDISKDKSQVSSIISWREVLDMGFSMKEEDYLKGLDLLKAEEPEKP